MTSEPLPAYFLQHLRDEGLKDDDFEIMFFTLLSRICALRAQHKRAGFVSEAMVEEANATSRQFDDWHPEFPAWVMPPGHRRPRKDGIAPSMVSPGPDKAERFIWVAMSWLLMHTARLLVFDIMIVYYRTQQAIAPSPETEQALQSATTAQIDLAQDIQDAVEYYLENIMTTQATTRSIGAHMLMMPLSVLLGLATTNGATLAWIARLSSRIADRFSMKQGKMMADFLMTGSRQETFALSPVNEPLSRKGTGLSSEGSPEAGGLPTPSPSPNRGPYSGPDILIS